MKIFRSLAIAAAAGAMALGVVGTTAASAEPVPASPGVPQAVAGGNGPAAAHTSGPTYILEHASKGYGNPVFMPAKFYLVGGRAANIYTSPTYWSYWYQNRAVGSGSMWGTRYGAHKVYVGHVTMRFYDRQFAYDSGGTMHSYFEKVLLSGILPGNGGSVQTWHWSFRSSNWVAGG